MNRYRKLRMIYQHAALRDYVKVRLAARAKANARRRTV